MAQQKVDGSQISSTSLDLSSTDGSTLTGIDAANLDSGVLDNARVAVGNVTQHQASLSIAFSQITGTVDADTVGGQPVGTGPLDIVALDSSSRLPAVDGSLLTNLPAGTQPDASTTVKGILRLATEFDVRTGTNSTEAVVPSTLVAALWHADMPSACPDRGGWTSGVLSGANMSSYSGKIITLTNADTLNFGLDDNSATGANGSGSGLVTLFSGSATIRANSTTVHIWQIRPAGILKSTLTGSSGVTITGPGLGRWVYQGTNQIHVYMVHA